MSFSYVLPKLLEATRLMIGPAMVYLIAAEMLFGDVGFGYRIRIQSKLLNMGSCILTWPCWLVRLSDGQSAQDPSKENGSLV